MKDIFTDMQAKIGCPYLSDLPYYKRAVWFEMKRLCLSDYPNTFTPEETAQAHIKLYREIDADIIKVMDDNFGKMLTKDVRIQKTSDWRDITLPGRDCEHYRRMESVIKLISQEVGDEVMIFPTLWSPFKLALFTLQAQGGSDETFMRDCKEDPESVIIGVQKIADVLADWTKGFLEAGATGVYYAGQFSEPQRFSAEEWEKLVKPSDLTVLNAVKANGGRVVLHICGEVEHGYRTCPERYREYPCDIVNWDVHRSGVSLKEGHELFQKPILGGMDNHGVLIEGTYGEIAEEAKRVVREYGKRGFMLGGGCTVPGNMDFGRLKAAIAAAKSV